MDAITYNINNPDYYGELSRFTDTVLASASQYLPSVKPFIAFVDENRRSDEEYQLELLMLGVYWHNYATYAMATSSRTTTLCNRLLKARNVSALKPLADTVRGILHTTLLMKESHHTSPNLTLPHQNRLIQWLSASGDFKEEALRLQKWQHFLKTKSEMEAGRYLRGAERFADWFVSAAFDALGKYTANVRVFKKNARRIYALREDIILVNRMESDYHLIMVGAEIMNRQLKKRFSNTTERIVLLPACMRPQHCECRGLSEGNEIACVCCNPKCEIGKIRAQSKDRFKIRVIAHASNFTDSLKKWQNQSNVGLVASACVLHLFTGGYEMQKLNIPAQCVFLNHCGCKAHWHKRGIPTSVNSRQLLAIAEIAPESESVGSSRDSIVALT